MFGPITVPFGSKMLFNTVTLHAIEVEDYIQVLHGLD